MKFNQLTKEHFYNTCLDLGINYNINKNIWLGFSGGLDSRVLLELSYLTFANNPNYKLHVVHITHTLIISLMALLFTLEKVVVDVPLQKEPILIGKTL